MVFSGKIAKNRRARNCSSKYGKHKERKRSPERSFSDSDDGAARSPRPLQKKHQPPPTKKEEKSGYSSSEETSERDLSGMAFRETTSNDDEPDNVSWEEVLQESGLRKRKHFRHEESALEQLRSQSLKIDDQTSDRDKAMEWEMVEQYAKESDLSLTTGNESSDDFWKSDSRTKLVVRKDKAKARTSKEDRPESRFKLLRWNWLDMLLSSRSEWKQFKAEHVEQLQIMKLQRNQCAIGLLIVTIFCGIGGVIFHSTEGAFEMFYKCGVKRVKRDFLDSLWSKSHYMREDEWKSLARTKLMEFENQLYDAYEAGMTSYSGQKGWSFLNSVIYSITVVTTIGE